MICYGDEIGLEGGNDPDCRQPMPWDEAAWNQRLRHLHRSLSRARRDHPALQYGSLEKMWIFNGVYAFRRHHGHDQVVVVLNPRVPRHAVHIPLEGAASEWRDLITGQVYRAEQGHLHVDSLGARTALVLFPR
jgi:glycosidase